MLMVKQGPFLTPRKHCTLSFIYATLTFNENTVLKVCTIFLFKNNERNRAPYLELDDYLDS